MSPSFPPRRSRAAPVSPAILPFIVFACCLFSTFSARAELIAWDDFEGYAPGTAINDKASGFGWSNEWSSESQANATVSGDPADFLTYDLGGAPGVTLGGGLALKLAGSAENALVRYVPPELGGRDIFVSFLFQIGGGTPGSAVSGNVFSGWQAQDAGSSVGNDSIGVVGLGGTAGARVKGTTTSFAQPLVYGRTYLFVIKYTGWEGNTYRSVQVWLDPATTDEFSADATVTRVHTVDEADAGSNGFLGLRVRTVGLSAGPYQLIDDLRIGTAWAAVVGPLPAPPDVVEHRSLVVFGDSLSSGGRTGTPSTGPLPTPTNGGYLRETWIQQLSPRAGYGPLYNYYVPGGTNYAIGGDTTTGMVAQIDRYFVNTGNTADPDALYVLWCGPNDISRAIDPARFWTAYADAENAARSARERMEAQLRRLAAAGATNFVWPNLPDLSKTPAINAYGSLGAAVAGPILRNATSTFNNGMSPAINRLKTEFPGIEIHPMDAAAWFNQIIDNKEDYGFTNVTGQSKTDNGYLFYDNVHPTSHGHKALADRALQFFITRDLLPTPLDRWRAQHFGTVIQTDDVADHADPDGDGVPNFLEYALGGHPLQPGAGVLPSIQLPNTSPEPSVLSLTFARIADPALTYAVQATDDLSDASSWTDIWTSVGVENEAGPVSVSDDTAPAGAPRRFLRLQVRR